jgi:hypothetical protein
MHKLKRSTNWRNRHIIINIKMMLEELRTIIITMPQNGWFTYKSQVSMLINQNKCQAHNRFFFISRPWAEEASRSLLRPPKYSPSLILVTGNICPHFRSTNSHSTHGDPRISNIDKKNLFFDQNYDSSIMLFFFFFNQRTLNYFTYFSTIYNKYYDNNINKLSWGR